MVFQNSLDTKVIVDNLDRLSLFVARDIDTVLIFDGRDDDLRLEGRDTVLIGGGDEFALLRVGQDEGNAIGRNLAVETFGSIEIAIILPSVKVESVGDAERLHGEIKDARILLILFCIENVDSDTILIDTGVDSNDIEAQGSIVFSEGLDNRGGILTIDAVLDVSRGRNDIADLRIEHLRKRHDSPVEGDATVIISRHIDQALDTGEEGVEISVDAVQLLTDLSLVSVERSGVDLLAEFIPNLGVGSHIVTDDTLDRRIDGGESLIDLRHLLLEDGGIDLLTDQFRQFPLEELILGVDIGDRSIGLQELADIRSLTESLLGLAESLVSGVLGILDLNLGFGHPSLDLSDSGSDLTEIGRKGGKGILDLVDVGLKGIQTSLQGNGGINQLLDSGIVLKRFLDPGLIGLLGEFALDPFLVSLLVLKLSDRILVGLHATL